MKKQVRRLKVTRNDRLNARHFILELQSPEALPQILPGNFVQVLVDNSPATFLRRPFSVHEVNIKKRSFRLLIQIKGEGTHHLSLLQKGSTVDVIFPLGNGFTLPPGDEVLLIGGGCGVAPLLYLAQYLKENGLNPTILTGWKSRDDIFEREEYMKFGDLLITTEDGSEGARGLVTDHPVLQKETLLYKKIYCCGPDPMMKAVAGLAAMHGIDCEVSLENTMACGFGVCLCCITPTVRGNERVCMEGPVFNTRDLTWEVMFNTDCAITGSKHIKDCR